MDGVAAEEEPPPPPPPPPPIPPPSCDSGNVSQSHSSASGLGDEDAAEGHPYEGERLLAPAAADYAGYLLPAGSVASGGQIETLDKSLEDLLTRVDEFVGMLDMIRSDSSQVVNESVPHIHAKAVEMRQLYRKIDKLEAFVKMVGNSVAGMEEQITKAESDFGTFPNTFKKLLHTINVPSFLNRLKCFSAHPNSFVSLTDEAVWMTSEMFQSQEKRSPVAMTQLPDKLTWVTENLHSLTCIPMRLMQKSSSSRPSQALYEAPDLFKTEDYFPCVGGTPYV